MRGTGPACWTFSRPGRAPGGGSAAALTGAVGGSRNAASDVGVAIELLLARLRAARLNVEINLARLHDAELVPRVMGEADVLERDATADAEAASRSLR